MLDQESLEQIRDEGRIRETREVLGVIANGMAMPLYLVFWGADLIYVPHLAWEFLIVRLLIIPLGFTIQYLSARARTTQQAQAVALLFNLGMASAINYMIFRIGDPTSIYYAGLNLVALGNLAFVPLQMPYFITIAAAIYAPFYLITIPMVTSMDQLYGLATNSFFNLGTIVILFVTRVFNERLRSNELKSQLALQSEIKSRELVIDVKTQEAIRVRSLSNQFSPQVVEAIQQGKIDVSTTEIHRSEICAIFIDIVNSTERVTRIDNSKVNKVIQMFMEDTIRTLLKYDITIDKFLGDGILAFCNDPIAYSDFPTRVVRAAYEIRERIENRQEEYENLWLNQLQLRMGIAVGYANIGFYGSPKFFKTYTAIGPVINLASRLSSAAEPGQILISQDVLDRLPSGEFQIKFVGKKTLKGFESDIIKVYSVDTELSRPAVHTPYSDCPECGTIMHLDTNQLGIHIFKCRNCGYIHDSQFKMVVGKAS